MKDNIITAFMFLLCAICPVHAQADHVPGSQGKRILLKIPYQDREDLLQVMRNNLKNLNKMIAALADDDFKTVEETANAMSFNKKKGKGLARRGNAAFIAMGVKFHAEDTVAVGKAAARRDRKATLRAISHMINTCVSCHSTFRVMEWPTDKVYQRPSPMKITLPDGLGDTK